MKEKYDGWMLDSSWIYLNHGSYGSTPLAIIEEQRKWQIEMESQPVLFFDKKLENYLFQARSSLANFVGTKPENISLISNVTEGVNSILRSFPWKKGDKLVLTSQSYGACTLAAKFIVERFGVELYFINIPIPLSEDEDIINLVINNLPEDTTMFLIDHITSSTGLILPINQLVSKIEKKGIPVLVDGAHGPGQIDLSLDRLGASYYVGNAHKWMCAPKGTAFIYVRNDRKRNFAPLSISHGWKPNTEFENFEQSMLWTGTRDLTSWLTIPFVIDYMSNIHDDGWTGLRHENTMRSKELRQLLENLFQVPPISPLNMVGHLCGVLLPKKIINKWPNWRKQHKAISEPHPFQKLLENEHKIQIMISSLGDNLVLRVSIQKYVTKDDINNLIRVLTQIIDT